MTENCVLLILAGPDFDTKREPLAWIGYPAVRKSEDFETQPDASRQLQAWQTTIREAATQADTTVPALGHVIHDAGFGSDLPPDDGWHKSATLSARSTPNSTSPPRPSTRPSCSATCVPAPRSPTSRWPSPGRIRKASQCWCSAPPKPTASAPSSLLRPSGRASSIPTATGSAPAARAMPTCRGGGCARTRTGQAYPQGFSD